MKARQFTGEQIVALLQQAEKGEKARTALCREQGITETTFYRWHRQFGGLSVKEVLASASWSGRTPVSNACSLEGTWR